MEKIKIGIVGYGNIGKGVELAAEQNPDMGLEAIFTRREPEYVETRSGVEVFSIDDANKFLDSIDVMVLCGGSATDLPQQGPYFASMFNTVDSYDTHAKIPHYFDSVDIAARAAGKTSVISTGWDPGLFSLLRVIQESCLPQGKAYTFWGPGVSQGHSDAIRRVKGVKDARQYTIPIQGALEQVRSGTNPELNTRQKHIRQCYVVAEDGSDHARIDEEIKSMPNYFADYDTSVTYISQEEMNRKHSKMPHGGFVMTSGQTGEGNKQMMEFGLKLDSNPEFTGNVLVAYARAACRLNKEGRTGAMTVFDIAPKYLSMTPNEELRKSKL